jgi:hypothetical protein
MGALSVKLPNIFEKTSSGLGLSEATRALFTKRQPYSMLEDDAANKIFDNFAKATESGAVALRDFNTETKDPGIKAYLSTVQNGAGDLADYQKYVGAANQALVQMSMKSKLAAIGMKALSMATSMAITMGVSLLISGAVELIQGLINKQANAIESAKEMSSAWEESDKKLKSAQDTIKSISSDYERLSKGVDEFGNNVSLNTDEFARYNNIANQIADLFPDMVAGWTNEGNAILKAKGNIEALTDAYANAKKVAAEQIVSQANTVVSGVKAALVPEANTIYNVKGAMGSAATQSVLANELVKALNTNDKAKIEKTYTSPIISSVFDEMFSKIGITDKSVDSIIKNGGKIRAYANTLVTQLNGYAAQTKPIIYSYFELDNDNYGKLSDDAKSVITSVVDKLNYSVFQELLSAEGANDNNIILNKLNDVELVEADFQYGPCQFRTDTEDLCWYNVKQEMADLNVIGDIKDYSTKRFPVFNR